MAQTTFQQEVDVLRGQVGSLNVISLWTGKNPPALAGVYGLALQQLEGGESLIRAFIRLHEASEANRANAKAILTLVQNYKTQSAKPPTKAT